VTQRGFAVLAEGGLADLGGLDVDQALLEHIGRQVSPRDPARWQRLLRPESTADRRAQRGLREDIKVAKETLSQHPQTEVPLPEPFDDVLVSRAELAALIRPNLLRSVEVLAATIAAAGGTPQQLAGIYLVGGSSRIPLVATLIAEGLRVVPTSLDQPETAVALGALHVPQEGISLRTQDLPVEQRPPASPPHPGGFPTPGGGFPPMQPQPLLPGQPSQVPAQRKPRRTKTLLLVSALIVVLLGAATGAWLYLTRPTPVTFPSAADCRTAGSPDGKGFTSCTRQLAGTIAERTCRSGQAVETSCDLGEGYQVTYRQLAADSVRDYVDRQLKDTGTHATVGADWRGNGLSGHYQSAATDKSGVLVFTVADRPLVGVLTKQGEEASQLADYFERAVLPGT
jgi:hypothetical protein